MDGRLFEAARTGSVSALHQLLAENPLVLADSALISPHENPLHVATKAGQLAFVKEMIKQKADLVSQENQDGFRPLDIASVLGHVEIVEEIIMTCHPDVCRLKGTHGRTCIHHAAINGRVEIIDKLLTSCGDSVKDLTSLGETALHLALKNHKLEAFTNLVKWLEKLGLEELVNWGDRDGNTVLHLAVCRKQLEIVELLLGSGNISNILELNARNSRGFTAMDLLDIVIENSNEVRLKEILQRAGGLGVQTPDHTLINTQIHPEPAPVVFEDWINYFKFKIGRDKPGDARDALLVVAALIATVTYQAAVDPPNSIFPDKTPANSLLVVPARVFSFGNTLGFSTSMVMIDYLTGGFPFNRELQLCIFAMAFSYGMAITSITPNDAIQYTTLFTALLLPYVLQKLPRGVRKRWQRPPS
ncbi:ankyrin repeat-containing protein BDA1-like [Pistacia vera]|uniref:ankyrin repeat-containing protein BDA1-like n=1 Tax=Pistacia vera TaxID=55513 RepID=UPI0012637C3C|nr:ankyrin repeat-containing protein BDA1-like [Pistacia vera]